MRVLVTGARGQVGAELVRALEGRAQVVAHDHASLDLSQPEAIRARIREARPEVIVNAGAYTAVDRAESEVDLARAVNGVAPGVIAEEAKRAGALLIHYSTDYVFDGTKTSPYVETDPTGPVSAYGRTKLEGEQAIAASGCAHTILRTSWIYAPRGKNFLLTMLALAAKQSQLRVVDDQRGAPTSAAQLARATMELIGMDPDRVAQASGIYHATAGGEVTWFGFAQAIFDSWARRAGPGFAKPHVTPIATREYPTPARRPAYSVLSNAKLERAFGIRLGDWRSGMEEVLSAVPR